MGRIEIGSNTCIFQIIAFFILMKIYNEPNYTLLMKSFIIVSQPGIFTKDGIIELKVEISGKDLESSYLELSVEGQSISFGSNIMIKYIRLDFNFVNKYFYFKSFFFNTKNIKNKCI